MLFESPVRSVARVIAVLSCAISIGCSDEAPVAPKPAGAAKLDVLPTPIITVMNTNDAGPGSLRQAISDAPTRSIIQFDAAIAGKTIVLTTGHLKVATHLTIEGPVPAGMTVSGGLHSQVMAVFGGGDVLLRNLSIVDGRDNEGGGIFVDDGTLVLDHSLVANNEASSNGGGILGRDGSDVTLLNSTVSGNVASLVGGGITARGALTIRNSTIAYNSASDLGGGVHFSDGSMSVRNSIIANNVNTSAPTDANCSLGATANVTFSGLNIADGNCASDPAILDANPLLGVLANNGGPTMTHALQFGSPAIDGGLLCSETTDQRYVARNQGITCDVGAFEFNDYATVSVTVGPNVATSKHGPTTVSGTISCSRPTSTTLTVSLSQTQKVTGRFTTIVQGNATTSVLSCESAPSSWSVVVTPAAGDFQNGSASASVTAAGLPSDFLPVDVTAAIKIFTVK